VPEAQSQSSSVPQVAIEGPACPMCHSPMPLARMMPRRLNFDLRTFQCRRCDHVKKVVTTDPMKSDVLGWLLGELRAPK
jgi:hypothetical protein